MFGQWANIQINKDYCHLPQSLALTRLDSVLCRMNTCSAYVYTLTYARVLALVTIDHKRDENETDLVQYSAQTKQGMGKHSPCPDGVTDLNTWLYPCYRTHLNGHQGDDEDWPDTVVVVCVCHDSRPILGAFALVVCCGCCREGRVLVGGVNEGTVGQWKNRMVLVLALRRFGHYPLTLLSSPWIFFLLPLPNRWSKIDFVLKQSRGNGSKLGSIVSNGSDRASINKMRAKGKVTARAE